MIHFGLADQVAEIPDEHADWINEPMLELAAGKALILAVRAVRADPELAHQEADRRREAILARETK